MTRRPVPPIGELRKIAQGAKSHRAEWQYRIHRKLSVYLTWALLHTPLTANQTSLLAFASGLIGAAMVLYGDSRWAWFGLVCFYGYFLLDKVDGEIARYRQQQSLRGVCLDYVGHLAIPPLVPLSVGGFLAGQTESGLFWLAGAAAALAVMFARAVRDIPSGILLRKSGAESALFEGVEAPGGERQASGARKRSGALRGFARAALWLASYWPSLVLLACALGAYALRPSLRPLLSGTFLLLCFLQLAIAGAAAMQTVRNIEGRVARSLRLLDRASRTVPRE
jgi:hypothetical protein